MVKKKIVKGKKFDVMLLNLPIMETSEYPHHYMIVANVFLVGSFLATEPLIKIGLLIFSLWWIAFYVIFWKSTDKLNERIREHNSKIYKIIGGLK